MLLFLSAGAVIVALGLEGRRELIWKAQSDALMLVESLAAQHELITTEAEFLLSTLAHTPAVQNIDPTACNELFRDLNNLHPFFLEIAAAKGDGSLFAASRPFDPGAVCCDPELIADTIRTMEFSVSALRHQEPPDDPTSSGAPQSGTPSSPRPLDSIEFSYPAPISTRAVREVRLQLYTAV